MTAPAYTSLLDDLAAHLATHGVAQWNPRGTYRVYSPPAVYLGVIPDEAGYAIALNTYAFDTDRDTGSPVVSVQVRCQGDRDPRTAVQIADRVYTLLHDQTNYRLDNNTSVLLSRRHLRAPEDRDTNGRWHQPDSYRFTLNPTG